VKLLIELVVFESGEIWTFVLQEEVEIVLFLFPGRHLDMVRSSSWKLVAVGGMAMFKD
jgi:hypothetical protein